MQTAQVAEKRGHFSPAVVCDVSQNPEKIFRGGAWLPTLARSSDLLLFKGSDDKRGQWLTQRELAFSQGWMTAIEGVGEKYESCMGFDLHSLTRRQQMSLQGNGMHLTSVASFLVFCMSHLVRRDTVADESRFNTVNYSRARESASSLSLTPFK